MFPSYFPMDNVKRGLVSAVCLVNCLTFALICAAMLTQEWTVVRPVRTGLNITLRPQDPETNRFQGVIHFGLFEGRKVLNYGFGNRVFHLKIVCASKLRACMYSAKDNATERIRDLHENFYLGSDDTNATAVNEDLPDFGVWICTVCSLSLSAMFAVTGAVFAVVNALRNSVELVFGFVGILVWNALGAVCGVVALMSWLVQHVTKFRRNAMTLEESLQHWVSEYRAAVGTSFYLVLVSALLSLCAVALVSAILRQPWVDRKLRSELRKKLSSMQQHSASSTMTKKSGNA